jgi:hypothetical protein
MSTLKHNIRQQQAQLHNLENIILRGPRPLPPGMLSSPPRSPDQQEFNLPPPPSYYNSSAKLQKRSSFDILHSIAPESNLPLPRRETPNASPSKQEGSIPEGIPVDFGAGTVSPNSYKRVSSPTRTLSRTSNRQILPQVVNQYTNGGPGIPVASVGSCDLLDLV